MSGVVAGPDLEDLRRKGCANVVLLRHGINPDVLGIRGRRATSQTALFVGNLSIRHNHDAAMYLLREIWPRIETRLPGARLIIAGARPRGELRRQAGRDGVELRSDLPSLVETWAEAEVFLAPMRFSAGIQNKVLEAMVVGIPVVTTAAVAEGIGASPGAHVLVSELPTDFATRACDVLEAPERFAAMAEQAKSYASSAFRWENVVRALEAVAETPIRPHQTPRR